MQWVARWLGRKPAKPQELEMSRLQASTREQTRRELIAMALRDTLKKHGLSQGCITAEPVPSGAPGRQRGMHIQMVFRDCEPGLSSYAVALEAAVKSRLERLDPLSASWITGLSWRFEPTDLAVWPQLPRHAQQRGLPPVLSDVVPLASATPVQKLLLAGESALQAGLGLRPDFSPTLPMPAR
jgi:hypothetical protein